MSNSSVLTFEQSTATITYQDVEAPRCKSCCKFGACQRRHQISMSSDLSMIDIQFSELQEPEVREVATNSTPSRHITIILESLHNPPLQNRPNRVSQRQAFRESRALSYMSGSEDAISMCRTSNRRSTLANLSRVTLKMALSVSSPSIRSWNSISHATRFLWDSVSLCTWRSRCSRNSPLV